LSKMIQLTLGFNEGDNENDAKLGLGPSVEDVSEAYDVLREAGVSNPPVEFTLNGVSTGRHKCEMPNTNAVSKPRKKRVPRS